MNSYNFKFKIYQMKTKFLLGALALPMFFAACANEELVEAQANVNLQERIPLGDVTLNFGNAESRLALTEGSFNAFEWSNGDDLGASLIDVRNATVFDENTHINKSVMYNLTSTPQTNYRYEYNNGAWTSNAAMVEGNYVFYMPYVENTNRVAPLAVLPVVQNLEEVTINGETAYTTYNDVLSNAKENGNIMAVAYKFLSAEGENNDGNKNISVSFKQLYATPLISIQNYARDTENELTDLTIKKIILSKSDASNFSVKQRLNFTAAAGSTALDEAFGAGGNSIVKCLNTVLNPNNEAYLGGAWAIGDNTVSKATQDVLTTTYSETGNGHFSKTITINVEDPITIASEETFSFYAVIPGGDYETGKLVVTFVTTEDKQVSVTLPAADINPGKRYAVNGYDEEGNVDSGAAALMAVTTEQLQDAPVLGVEIATQAELYTTIAKAVLVDSDADGAADDKVSFDFVAAEGVVLNDQVINMLNTKKDVIESVTFHNDMVVNSLTANNQVKIMIDGKATMNGVVVATIGKTTNTGRIAVSGVVTVAEGATAKLRGKFASGIKNNGKLIMTDYIESDVAVENNGELNMAANALTLTTGNLANKAGAVINATSATAQISAAKIVNEGDINVVVDEENAIEGTLTVTGQIENKGVITAANTLSVSAKFTNKSAGELNLTAGTATLSGVFENEGTVNVSEGAVFSGNVANSINKGTINNAGTLTIYQNVGTINVTNSSKFGTSETYVTAKYTNASSVDVWGNIYNPSAKTIGTEAMDGTACQYVWNSTEAYTGEIDWVESDGTFNAVKYNNATVSAAATSAATELIYVEFNGYSKLEATGQLDMPIAVKVNVNELEIAGASAVLEWPANAKLTVVKNATLGWNDPVNFGTVTIDNAGKVYGNAGTMTGITKTGAGVYVGF